MAVDPVVEVAEKVEESVAATKEVEEIVAATKEVEEGVVTTKDSSEELKTPEKRSGEEEGCDRGEVPPSPDPYYPPIIYLPEVVVNSGEEEEEEAFKRRAKLYRYAHEETPAEWKERGTGEVKIMRHPETGSARIIMRREKTMKVCANHSILAWMDLKPNCGSQKAWVWKTQADFADALCEEDRPKQETLAIRFGTIDNAKAFEAAFLEARQYVLENQARMIREEERGQGDGQKGEEGEGGENEEEAAKGAKDPGESAINKVLNKVLAVEPPPSTSCSTVEEEEDAEAKEAELTGKLSDLAV